MTQATQTFLLRGGLNLITPPVSIPAGQAIAAVNYEPDVAGYSRIGGFERFDGHPQPSDSSDPVTIAARRAAISAVPGTGPVLGGQVFEGHIYAFRDSLTGEGKMHRDSAAGWETMTFGSLVEFSSGMAEFLEGEILVGGTSGATATIERVVRRSGLWGSTATGYLVISGLTGTFTAETVTSASGSATATSSYAVTLPPGGHYDFTTHNFYGAAKRPSLYFANGAGYSFEWTGEILSPIKTGTSAGVLEETVHILTRAGDRIVTRSGDPIILRVQFDAPIFVNHYKNHLFLAYRSGSVIFSSIGEPLEYITTTGAGELSFGEPVTGLLTSAATSLVIFGQNRIEFVTGNDSSDFLMQPITDGAGAVSRSAQMMAKPVYLDDGGLRDLNTTAAFGDWRAGTLSQMVEPLMKAKRDAGVGVAASIVVRGKDQYRLFFDDGSGVTLYIGRKSPEILPFNLPIDVTCAWTGEVNAGEGDRLFVGTADGFVYELDRGLSFDGATIDAYIRLPFNSFGSSSQNHRFHRAEFDISTPDDIEIGMMFDLDYSTGLPASQVDVDIEAGSPTITTELYANVDWTVPVQGRLEAHIDGFGRNLAATLISSAADKRSHTISSATFNFSPRGLVR